ncbi:MAG: hypothetical protein IPK68_04470 [Bdellovibrionales bacterium]|nr:hypothetical protein [Bdellovibrionales bacterium]
MGRSKFLFPILMMLSFSSAIAQTSSLDAIDHKVIRRITVFPIKTESLLTEAAEEAWWKMREALTENKRFLVASKNYLVQKDVFQSRGELSPADAIILGRLLDADALVVTYLKDKILHMRIYEGQYGRSLWHKEFQLHASIPVAKQIVSSTKKLVLDFIASVPYQGFVITDGLIGKSVFSEGEKNLVKINIGENAAVEIGDQVQMVRIKSDSLRPLFLDGAISEIFAEGRVVSISREIIVVEVLRATNIDEIRELSLVRLPTESKRLRDIYGLNQNGERGVPYPEMLVPGISDLNPDEAEKKPLLMAVSFVLNLAAFLILAF